MKKVLFSLGLVLLVSGIANAQEKQKKMTVKPAAQTAAAAPASAAAQTPATTLKPENLNFKTEVHDFGTVEEGPAAEYEFAFTNTGKEPLIPAKCACLMRLYYTFLF